MSRFQILTGVLGFIFFASWAMGIQRPTENFTAENLSFFSNEVRPILQNQCALCHDSTKRMSGFSVESRESILKGGNRGAAAEAGKPEQSRLIEAIRYNGELKMPPTGKLADKDIATLERWVALGLSMPSATTAQKAPAKTTAHWAFQPIQRSREPDVKNTAWAKNAIDRFVLARLEKEGFTPSPEASRAKLIRRLSLDLTGLLPSPA